MQEDTNFSKKHISELDAVRGIAIILVMLYHFSIPLHHDQNLIAFDYYFIRLLQSGWMGVDLFFVLSGFLITGILLDTRNKKNYFSSFFARRTLRIFPLYFGFLFVLIILLPSISSSFAIKFSSLIENQFWFWTYLSNWRIAYLGGFSEMPAGYLWSLAVEEQFYLIWPLIVYFGHRYIKQLIFLLIALSLSLRFYFLNEGVSTTSVYVMTFSHMDSLLLGAMVAVFVRESMPKIPIKYNSLQLALVFFLICFLGIFIVFNGNFAYYSANVLRYGMFVVAFIFACFVLLVVLRDSSTKYTLLNSKSLQNVGKYSYALYLFHHPVGIIVEEHIFSSSSFMLLGSKIPAALLSYSISATVSYILAIASWNIYEKHFLKLKHHFEAKN